MARILEKDYSHIAPHYDETRYLGRKARFTSTCEGALLRKVVQRYAARRGVLLDIACGTGNFTAHVADLFRRVVGLDLTFAMLKRADTHETLACRSVAFVQASATQLPIRPRSGDVVMTTRFLHLFPRERHREILEGLLPTLRPGGTIIVEHDSPLLEAVEWFWNLLHGRWRREWSSYHPAEMPQGVQRVTRLGVSAPGLPTLSLVMPRVAQRLTGVFVHWPLNLLSTFVIVVYRKAC